MKDIIAIAMADSHFSLKPPVFRSKEEDWLKTQGSYIEQAKMLCSKYNCPLLHSGDITDRWNNTPELFNWFYPQFRFNTVLTIAGQHDMPQHSMDLMGKSFYLSLKYAGSIQPILYDRPMTFKQGHKLYGFDWGSKIKKAPKNEKGLNIALVHKYVWIEGKSYPQAPKENKLSKKDSVLESYDVVIFGDNHKGFKTKIGNTTIFNCGTFMVRKSDEINYKPMVGLITADGNVIPHYLDTSKDVYLGIRKQSEQPIVDLSDFIDELEKLGNDTLDFESAIQRYFKSNKTEREVKHIILEAMNE